jgi:hypothetical protein
MTTEIIKVQLPITDTDQDSLAHIYDKEHKHECTQPVDGFTLRIMKGKLKKFFYAEWMEDVERWRVIDEAPTQDW